MWKNINFFLYICSSKRCLTVVGSATALHSFNPSRGSSRINRGFQMRWSAARGDCQKYSDYYAYRTRKNNIFFVKFMKSCFFPSKSFSLMQVNGISLTGMYHQEVVSTLKKVSSQSTYIPRVPQCLSPRPNWDHPTSSPASKCVPHPDQRGEANSPAGEGVGGGVQIGTTEEKAWGWAGSACWASKLQETTPNLQRKHPALQNMTFLLLILFC
jgi:hypothetical protein